MSSPAGSPRFPVGRLRPPPPTHTPPVPPTVTPTWRPTTARNSPVHCFQHTASPRACPCCKQRADTHTHTQTRTHTHIHTHTCAHSDVGLPIERQMKIWKLERECVLSSLLAFVGHVTQSTHDGCLDNSAPPSPRRSPDHLAPLRPTPPTHPTTAC